MYEQPTEASSVRFRNPSRFDGLTKNSDLQPVQSSAFALNGRFSGEADRFIASPRSVHPSSKLDGRTTPPIPDISRRDAIRRLLDRAVEQSQQMIEAAETGDLMELSNAGFRLVNTLEDLWNLRFDRENNWGDLLNLLQTVLAKEEFEAFAPTQCKGIREILSDYLRPWTVEDDDLRSSIKLLHEAGFDPWKGISRPKEGS